MRAGLSGNQYAVTLLILRESYGWNRKATGPMGLKTMANRTGIARSSIQLALRSLRITGIVSQEKSGGWSFKKDHEKWVGASPLAPGGQPTGRKGPAHWPRGASPLAERGQPTGPKTSNSSSREQAPKDIKDIRKETKKTTAPSADDLIRGIDKTVKTFFKSDFSDYQVKYFGGYRGRRVIDIPIDELEFALNSGRCGGDKEAFAWAVRLKRGELMSQRSK